MTGESSLSVGTCVTLACLWEITAPKPGNVHRGADFEDVSFNDFVTSAAVVGPILQRANPNSIGDTIRDAVQATKRTVGTNTNLGSLLLLTPLAAVPKSTSLVDGIGDVLDGLTVQDTALVYEAIRDASAGGLGEVEKADVQSSLPPEMDLVSVMRLAADRDLIARQYADGFQEVFEEAAESIVRVLAQGWPLNTAIIHTQLQLLSTWPDSLIERKCGRATAQQASDRAAKVLASGSPAEDAYKQGLAELDFWLRSDGHRRNPGTTADLIVAGLFVLLREGQVEWPVKFV